MRGGEGPRAAAGADEERESGRPWRVLALTAAALRVTWTRRMRTRGVALVVVEHGDGAVAGDLWAQGRSSEADGEGLVGWSVVSSTVGTVRTCAVSARVPR